LREVVARTRKRTEDEKGGGGGRGRRGRGGGDTSFAEKAQYARPIRRQRVGTTKGAERKEGEWKAG